MHAGPVLCLGHAVRRFTLGAGPLKRPTDRLQLLMRVLLVGVVVLAPALGASAGTVASDRSSAQAAADASRLEQVAAVLQDDAVRSPGSTVEEPVWVPAAWTSPRGLAVEGRVPVPAGASAGDQISIWVTADGQRHRAPLGADDIAVRSVTIGIVATLGAALAAGLGYLGGVALLDRSRSRRWAVGWAAVEPSWRRQVLR